MAGSLAQPWPGDRGQALPGFRVTWLTLGRAGRRPWRARFRVTCLGLGGHGFRVASPARPPTTREPPGLRGRPRRQQGRRAPTRRTGRPPGPRPRPGRAGGAVSWFFQTAVQTLLSETRSVRASAPSRGPRPSGAPGSIRESSRRGPGAGSRVTWPKKGETARWRPPFRAGAVSRGAATAGGEGSRALRRLKAPGSVALGRLSGNPAQGVLCCAWGCWLSGNPAQVCLPSGPLGCPRAQPGAQTPLRFSFGRLLRGYCHGPVWHRSGAVRFPAFSFLGPQGGSRRKEIHGYVCVCLLKERPAGSFYMCATP